MSIWFRILWIVVILFNTISLIWYTLGSSANFQRSLDLVERITLIAYGVPSFVLASLFIHLLVKRKGTCSASIYTLGGAQPLLQSVRTEGWLYEPVQRDPIRVTAVCILQLHLNNTSS